MAVSIVRQEWPEGFATAVHLAVDLRTGAFTLGNAGHPAPIQFTAGSGRWSVLESAGGPVLGIIPEVQFPRSAGRLGRGDALVLYTDGVTECENTKGMLGVEPVLQAFSGSGRPDNNPEDPEATVKTITDLVFTHAGTGVPGDDVTVLVIGREHESYEGSSPIVHPQCDART